MAHKHRPSERTWKEKVGNDFAGLSANGANFHGFCRSTGAHMITDVCSCGAWRYACPTTGRVAWLQRPTES